MFPAALPGVVSETDALNRVLSACGLMLVGSAASLDPASDASMALAALRNVFRAESYKGWYCFNKRDGVKLTVREDGEVHPDGLILKCEMSPRALAYNCGLPRVTISSPAGGVQKLVRLPERTYNFSDVNGEIEVDIVYGFGIEDAPEAFVEHVVAKTAYRFGPHVSAQIDPEWVREAEVALQDAEVDHEPRYNAFEDDPHTARTWVR